MERERLLTCPGPRCSALDLSIFHVASGHANEIAQTQGNQSIRERPEGHRDMMLPMVRVSVLKTHERARAARELNSGNFTLTRLNVTFKLNGGCRCHGENFRFAGYPPSSRCWPRENDGGTLYLSAFSFQSSAARSLKSESISHTAFAPRLTLFLFPSVV